jgi:hypothetical protein
MKNSIYTIESNALIATISRGVKTKFDWLLEVSSKCGGELICQNYRAIHLTKKSSISEFNRLKQTPFLIKLK